MLALLSLYLLRLGRKSSKPTLVPHLPEAIFLNIIVTILSLCFNKLTYLCLTNSTYPSAFTNLRYLYPKLADLHYRLSWEWIEMVQAFPHAGVPFKVFRNEKVRSWLKKNVKNDKTLRWVFPAESGQNNWSERASRQLKNFEEFSV